MITYQVIGIEFSNPNNILGRDASYNAEKIIDIFNGKLNEFSEAVCLNSAAALVIAGKYNEFEEAFKFSKNHISSGNTINHLKQMQIS